MVGFMMKSRRPCRRVSTVLVVLVAFSFLLAACGGGVKNEEAAAKTDVQGAGKTDEGAKASKTAEKIEKAIEKSTEIKMESLIKMSKEAKAQTSYTYDPINKVDPFSRFIASMGAPALGGKDENVLTKYEIRYFRLVGIVVDEAQPRAIFEDPRGHAFVVGIGAPIGRNMGVIDQILPDKVVVMEQRFVPGGPVEYETVPVVIKLHPEQEKES